MSPLRSPKPVPITHSAKRSGAPCELPKTESPGAAQLELAYGLALILPTYHPRISGCIPECVARARKLVCRVHARAKQAFAIGKPLIEASAREWNPYFKNDTTFKSVSVGNARTQRKMLLP